jgi:hypothetical protein
MCFLLNLRQVQNYHYFRTHSPNVFLNARFSIEKAKPSPSITNGNMLNEGQEDGSELRPEDDNAWTTPRESFV